MKTEDLHKLRRRLDTDKALTDQPVQMATAMMELETLFGLRMLVSGQEIMEESQIMI